MLDEAGIKYIKIEEGQEYDLSGVSINGFGNLHAEIYETYGRVQNTGYMVDKLCYPGDAFANPNTEVDIVALPVTGPWMRIKDAIDYAKMLKPRVAFPVHDAHIHEWAGFILKVPNLLLGEVGIDFKKMDLGKEENL